MAPSQPLTRMTSEEASAIRRELGLTTDALAAELGTTPHVVEAWESGRMGIPDRQAQTLRWRGAVHEREKALDASDLPECQWLEAWGEEPIPEKIKDANAHLERLVQHQKSCPTCEARDRFVSERFGPMPQPPQGVRSRVFTWLVDTSDKLPPWARPAFWAGLAFGAYSIMRIFFMIPALMRQPERWLIALAGLVASVAIGSLVGLTYGALRALWNRLRRPAV
jgi:transcriptional regulator with XRE-family HTH domain